MEESALEEMKRVVAFDAADAAGLGALSKPMAPALAGIAEAFYERINRDAVVASMMRRSGGDRAQLQRRVRQWLEGLFSGTYDASHFSRVSTIGQAHAPIPQQYIIAAMNLMRTALVEAAFRQRAVEAGEAIRLINRILDVELAVMLDSYREDYLRSVRQAERDRMERRLEEVSHLANVGELAASLAHEIKNPLAGISGAIQVIGAGLDMDDPRREIIAEILSQIDRLDRTARDLLLYARPKPPALTSKDMGKVAQRTLRFLRQVPAVHRVPVRFQGLECDATARVDEAQIEQVLSNLIFNAVHACEADGEVVVALSVDPVRVSIEIADTGEGMTRDSLERAFEPFFTTKAKGTGLGLAICRRIVDAHEGEISIDSTEGKGTRVRVVLPR